MSLEPFPSGTAMPETTWSVGARSPLTWRQTKNWPLPDVPYDIPLTAADFAKDAEYPPKRAAQRNRNLTALRNLYRGDLSDFVEDTTAVKVTVNYFFRLAEVISALLVSTEPPVELADQIQANIISMLTYGRGYYVRYGDMLFVPEAYNVWSDAEDEDTIHVVSQYVSADSEDGSFDRAYVYTVTESEATIADVELAEGKFGNVLGTETTSGGWAAADRPPVLDNWGQSAFEQLVPLVVELALRMSGVSYVVGHHEDPLLIMSGAEADMTGQLNLGGNPDSLADTGPAFIQRATQTLLRVSAAWFPNGSGEPKYLTWDGQLAASFAQIEELNQALSMMTGLVQLLDMDKASPASGTALREQHRVLSWTAGAIWQRNKEAAELVVGPFEWPNPFAEEPEVEDMEINDDPDEDEGDDEEAA